MYKLSVHLVGHCPYGGGCSPDRNETVVVVIEEIPRLWVDVWTQPRQSNHATEMTISHRLGKQAKTATILIENSPSVVVVVSFCFQTSTERHGRFVFTGHIRGGWLSLHSAERIMLYPLPPPQLLCLRNVFLEISRETRECQCLFFLSPLRVSSLMGLDFSVALPHVSRLILAYSTI
jgi:hypothetical protein